MVKRRKTKWIRRTLERSVLLTSIVIPEPQATAAQVREKADKGELPGS